MGIIVLILIIIYYLASEYLHPFISNLTEDNRFNTIIGGMVSKHTQYHIPYHKLIKHVNPDFNVKKIKVIDNITSPINITVIDEGHLIGGSKQRIVPMLLAKVDEKEIIYAGPSTGYAQVALSYICHMMNKKAILFLDAGHRPLTQIARKFGAKVFHFKKPLKYIANQAEKYHRKHRYKSHVLPFGMNTNYTVSLYTKAFKPISHLKPKRLWVVAGSGLILKSLSKVFPDTKFMVVQVGKKIWPDQLPEKSELFISPLRFVDPIAETPPYDTLLNYDAKLWPFVLKHGQEGDFIWNTASNPKPANIIQNEMNKIRKLKQSFVPLTDIPKHRSSMDSSQVMFDRLVKTASELKPSTIVRRNFTNDYYTIDGMSNHFTEDVRMNCVVNRGLKISPLEYLERNIEKISHRAAFLYNPVHNKDMLDVANMYNGYRECNTFNPFVLINFVKRVGKSDQITILDPSMGWGDRLIACLALDVKSYTGFDPNLKLHEPYNQISKLNNNVKCKFIPEKFKFTGDLYDIVMTSPPFFNFELYEFTKEDDNLSDYTKWLKDMYEPYLNDISKSVKPGGYVGIYIDDIGKYKTGKDTCSILGKNLKFIERLIFKNDYCDFNDILHEGRERSLWVFSRPM